MLQRFKDSLSDDLCFHLEKGVSCVQVPGGQRQEVWSV